MSTQNILSAAQASCSVLLDERQHLPVLRSDLPHYLAADGQPIRSGTPRRMVAGVKVRVRPSAPAGVMIRGERIDSVPPEIV